MKYWYCEEKFEVGHSRDLKGLFFEFSDIPFAVAVVVL